MPLPPPEPRDELHLRRIEARGYRRRDGLFDVEARIVDTKAHALKLESSQREVPAGEHLHEMTVRITFDADCVVREALAVTDAAPHAICPEAAASLAQLKGVTIGAGWNRAIRDKLGGSRGCQHINELLAQMATVAVQTLAPVRKAQPPRLDAAGRPLKIDSCYAYGSTRPLVRMRWPEYYDGPQAG